MTAHELLLGGLTAPHSGHSRGSVNTTFLHVSIPDPPTLLPCIVFYIGFNLIWQECDPNQPDKMTLEAEVIEGG